jgi:hypothetical protein
VTGERGYLTIRYFFAALRCGVGAGFPWFNAFSIAICASIMPAALGRDHQFPDGGLPVRLPGFLFSGRSM